MERIINFKNEIINQIEDSATLKEKLIKSHTEVINDITNIIINAYKNNKKVNDIQK